MNNTPATEPNTEQASRSPKKNRRRISLMRSLAASVLFTVAGNTAIAASNGGPLTFKIKDETVTTTHDKETGDPRLQKVTSSEGIESTYTVPADWARDYEASVGPESLDYSELDALVNQAKELSQPITIRLSGHASAEDTASTDDPNVGMATDNPSNINTAQSRAAMLQQAIQQRFASENIQANIEFSNPQEDELSAEEIEYVNSLASQQGYESTTAMVKKWNRDPSSVSPAVHAALMLLLGDERYVTAEISGTIDTVSYICVIPVIETTRTDVNESETKVPYFIPIPLLIFKKKRDLEDPEDLEDLELPPGQEPVAGTGTETGTEVPEAKIGTAMPEVPPELATEEPLALGQEPELEPRTEELGAKIETAIGSRTKSVVDQLSYPEIVKSEGKGFFLKFRTPDLSRVLRVVPVVILATAPFFAWYTTPIELDSCAVTISKGENEFGSLDSFDVHWRSCGGGSPGAGHNHAADEPCGVDESIVQTDRRSIYFYNGKLVSRENLPSTIQSRLPEQP